MTRKNIKVENQLSTEEIELENVDSQTHPHRYVETFQGNWREDRQLHNRNSEQQQTPTNFHPQLLKLAILNIFSNIIVPLVAVVDAAFLGHLPDIRHLAGVSLATVIFNYIYWSCIFLNLSTTGQTAQALGRGVHHQVLLILLRNCSIALLLGVMIVLLQHPLREIGFHLLSGTIEVKAKAQEYFDARIWDAPPTLINMVLMAWFIGKQQGSKALVISLVSGGTNIVLDYLLIVSWGWGSMGAGIATAASQYLSFTVGLIFLVRENWLALIPKVYRQIFQLQELGNVLKLNRDFFIAEFITISTSVLLLNLSATFGTLILVSNSLMFQFLTISIFVIEGFAMATQVIVGSYHGAGANQQLASVLKFSLKISLSIGLTLAMMFVLFSDSLFGLLTNHAEAIAVIHHQAFWLLPIIGCISLTYILDGYFIGLNQSLIVLKSRVLSAVFGFAPVAVIGWKLHSSEVLWLALLLCMATRGVFLGRNVFSTTKDLELRDI